MNWRLRLRRDLPWFLMGLALFLTIGEGRAQDGSAPPFALGVGARALALGGAFVAVADDYSAPYWNPAALAIFKVASVGYAGARHFDRGTGWSFLSGGAALHLSLRGPWSLHGAGGLGWIRARIPGIQVFGPGGEPLGTVDEENHLLLGATAIGVRHGSFGISLGYSLKRYSRLLGEETGGGLGSDLGLLIDLGRVLLLGVALHDWGGTEIRWSSGALDRIRSEIRWGVAARLLHQAMTPSAERRPPRGSTHLGIELDPLRIVGLSSAFRLAVRLGVRIEPPGLEMAFGVGIGLLGLRVEGALIAHPKRGAVGVIAGSFSL